MFEEFAFSVRTTDRLGNLWGGGGRGGGGVVEWSLKSGKKSESYVNFKVPNSHLWMNLTG